MAGAFCIPVKNLFLDFDAQRAGFGPTLYANHVQALNEVGTVDGEVAYLTAVQLAIEQLANGGCQPAGRRCGPARSYRANGRARRAMKRR